MLIGIDARMIESSGIGTYIRNLIYWLPKISGHKYMLFGNASKLKKYDMPVTEADFPIYGLGEQIFFPGIIKKAKVGLFHSTHYTIPVMYQGKMVVNIHDLIHLVYPEYLSSKPAYYYAKFMISSACRKAVKIITISENTKNDIIKYFNVEPSKIKITYPAVSDDFNFSPAKSEIMKKKYGEYILYVGAIRPHKNILLLIDAFFKLKKEKKIKHKLILIGKGKIPYIYAVGKKISDFSLVNEVLIMEEIEQDKLINFYCGANMFIFPSLYEGFGLPPLEAMACGCPVVCSNNSSLPEVVGGSALTISPTSADELVSAIYRVITDVNLRNNLIEKGLERAKMFSWKKMAEETLKIYEEVI
ncbi:MAG: glycosyltransferase family 1 protein [Elusimicrobiota bacterium]|nr:glycosyltransferase family 1 protein [Elusimicrobiota bacterium]